MADHTFAVVSYLSGQPAEFINGFRRRLNPVYGEWLAHLSVLPPRRLSGSVEDCLALLRRQCEQIAPLDVALDGVSTFWPVSGVVYLSISEGYQELVALHDLLNVETMQSREAHRYVPHITVAQELDESSTHSVHEEVARAWSDLAQPFRLRVDSLVLVEQAAPNQWIDVAPIPLGSLSFTGRR